MNRASLDGQTVQAVSRAMTLLKQLSRDHIRGKSLTELLEATQLNRSTGSRLLNCLIESGYAQRDDADGRYRLGINAMQLGLIAMSRPPIVERCKPLMKVLARSTGDTVLLVVRNGDFAHCLHVEQGTFVVRVIAALVGSFRLLGEGTAGCALLATLSDWERHCLFLRHADDFERRGLSEERLRRIAQRARKDGYASGINLIARGANAVAVSFEATPGHFAALSIGAVAGRLDEARRAEVASLMKEVLRGAGFVPAL